MSINNDYIYDNKTKKNIPIIADVIVIGGGIAGLTAADKQAEVGRSCAIFEQRKTFMSGASGINPGRAGLGFHYADLPTAFTYLKATIDFIKKYKKEGHDFRLGADKFSEDDAMRRGRYFIPKESLIPAEKLIGVYQAIKKEYERLIAEDPENKVFGDFDTFYKMLASEDYRDDIETKNITLAIETREQLLDVPRFRDYLISKVMDNPQIESMTDSKIIHIERSADAQYFIVTVEHNGEIKKYAATQIINASWESTDKLNQTLGVPMEPPGYDLILKYDIDDEEAAKLAKKYKAPIAIKNPQGEIRIYGNQGHVSDIDQKKWATRPLNKDAFSRVNFPESKTDQIILNKGAVPVFVREEIERVPFILKYDITDQEAADLSKQYDLAAIIIKDAQGQLRMYDPADIEKPTVKLNEGSFDTALFPINKFDKVFYSKNSGICNSAQSAHVPSAFRTNRVKVLAKVKLPESLKNKPCMFFAIGPFCMFSNMQDGTGLITYAPTTNYIQSRAVSLTSQEEAKLHEGFTEDETRRIGQEIINGVAKYIPEMTHAELIEIRGGVVKTYGDVDLCDPHSDFHKRRELGIQEVAIDALEISSMKLLYGPENAEQANTLLGIFNLVKDKINSMSVELVKSYDELPVYSGLNSVFMNCISYLFNSLLNFYPKSELVSTRVLENYFSVYLKHYCGTKDINNSTTSAQIMDNMQNVITNKAKAIQELKAASSSLPRSRNFQ